MFQSLGRYACCASHYTFSCLYLNRVPAAIGKIKVIGSFFFIISLFKSTYYGRPLSVSGRLLYFANVFFYIYFFNGRLILRPWLTEVRESFTRGGPWVSLEKLLLRFFLVILKLQGGPKIDEILPIFRPHLQTFCSHARTRQNIVILKKNLLSTDGCSTVMPRFMNFGVQTLEIHAPHYCS